MWWWHKKKCILLYTDPTIPCNLGSAAFALNPGGVARGDRGQIYIGNLPTVAHKKKTIDSRTCTSSLAIQNLYQEQGLTID